MLTKKKLLARVVELEERLTELENMHARVRAANSWESLRPFGDFTCQGLEANYGNRYLTGDEIRGMPRHPLAKERTAWTKTVSNVTLQELAQLVLDGTPIVRKKNETVTVHVEHGPLLKTERVETSLGAIEMTSRKE